MRVVKLTDICRPRQWPTLSKKEMSPDGYPVYGANGKIGFSENYTHEHPVILIGCRGSCGTLHITDPKSYANGNAMALDELDEGSVDRKFLFYFLKGRGFQDVISGSSQPQITQGGLAQVKVRLPELLEQQRIAAILEKADGLRRKRQEAMRLADEFLKALFVDMFGDPVSNSQCWPVQRLASLGDLDRGVSKHRPRNDPSLLGGEYPLIQTGDVANCDGYVRSFVATYSDKGLRQSRLWPAGTLCITIAANIAKTGILLFPACFPDSVVGFSSQHSATIEYVRFWLSFLQQTLEANAPASAQKNINLAILRELQIPVPPQDQVERFAAVVMKVESMREAQRLALDETQNLTRALGYQFMVN